MPVNGFTLISIRVSDQDRAIDFYKALGFTVQNDHIMGEEEMPPEPDLRWVEVVPPAGKPSMVLATWDVNGLPVGKQSLSLSCDDVHGVLDELKRAGIEPDSPVLDADWGSFFSVSDPDGNAFLVVQEKK
jgi:catechol 2,3-dioxygenase-like lactoylglutathione lyase family enzyme